MKKTTKPQKRSPLTPAEETALEEDAQRILSAAPGGVSPNSHTSDEPTSAIQVVAPGKLTDADLGVIVTEQYHRACGGMTEVLKFGVLMMQIREVIESARGLKSEKHIGSGRFEADSGVEAWLKEHAPEVKKATAYRFLHVAEAVAKEFENTSTLTFVDLVTSPTELLPEPARLSQQELWDFVSGTSQRSWLDRFAPAEKKPALPLKPLPKRTEEEIEKIHREREIEIFDAVYRSFGKKTWHYLPDQLIKGSIDMFEEFITEAKAHLAVPKRDRVALKIKAALTDK